MHLTPQAVLIGAVAAVGILHTLVPDHWLPIALLARQRGWSRAQTARAALGAGTGHVVSTLVIGIVVWLAGAAFATRFGTVLSAVSSAALIGFGAWIALASLREINAHAHAHTHGHAHDHAQTAGSRTALLLILGSSPMVEGLPAFFAAGTFGPGLVALMAAVFAGATIATYVVLCVFSTAGLQRVKLGRIERYGEVLSGSLIMLVGCAFAVWPAR
jgi:ABC-type nickel/cobalt efflux system permease component RcnA